MTHIPKLNIKPILPFGMAQQAAVLNNNSKQEQKDLGPSTHMMLATSIHIWPRVILIFLNCFVFINHFPFHAIFTTALFSSCLLCLPAALWLAVMGKLRNYLWIVSMQIQPTLMASFCLWEQKVFSQCTHTRYHPQPKWKIHSSI